MIWLEISHEIPIRLEISPRCFFIQPIFLLWYIIIACPCYSCIDIMAFNTLQYRNAQIAGAQTNFMVVNRGSPTAGPFSDYGRRTDVLMPPNVPYTGTATGTLTVAQLQSSLLILNGQSGATGSNLYVLPSCQAILQAFPSLGVGGTIKVDVVNRGLVPVVIQAPGGLGGAGDPLNATGFASVTIFPFSFVVGLGLTGFINVSGTQSLAPIGGRPMFIQIQSVNGSTGTSTPFTPAGATGTYWVF